MNIDKEKRNRIKWTVGILFLVAFLLYISIYVLTLRT